MIIDATENPHEVLSNFADSAFSLDPTDNHVDIIAKRRLPFEILLRNGGARTRAAAQAAISLIDKRHRRESEAADDLYGDHDQRFE